MPVKLVLQQCESAQLTLPDGPVVTVGRGVVVFVCFTSPVTEENVRKSAKTCLSVKLSEDPVSGKRTSVTSVSGDVLIVPQATLGGKLKGSSVQYHGNVKRDEGEEMYRLFCDEMRAGVGAGSVVEGVYGARQVLSTVTNGPFSHVIEIGD